MELLKKIIEMVISQNLGAKLTRSVLGLIVWFVTRNIEYASGMDLIMMASGIAILIWIILKSLRDVDDKKWYCITEENSRTYKKMVKKHTGEKLFFASLTLLLFINGITILEKFFGFSKVVNEGWSSFIFVTVLFVILVKIISLHMAIFYHLGWVLAILFYIEMYSSESVLGGAVYVIFIFIFYLITAMYMDFHTVRKIARLDVILAFIITLILPIFLQVKSSFIISLVAASYGISTLMVKIKSGAGIFIAEYEYENILNKQKSGKNPTYETLRDCIYYGGDVYKEKIMENPQFRTVIIDTEKNSIGDIPLKFFEKISIKIKRIFTRDRVVKILKKIL